mgnify:CR=1 FL=1|jgi:hypothetical protein
MTNEFARKVKEWSNPDWIFYQADHADGSDIVGKFLTYGRRLVTEGVGATIRKAIESGVIDHAKHSNTESGHINRNARNPDEYVVCWYSSDNRDRLQSLAEFLVENGMVRKTQGGRLYNIAFKYDSQTRAGEYGEGFVAEIKLADFIDLDTGKPKNDTGASEREQSENRTGV